MGKERSPVALAALAILALSAPASARAESPAGKPTEAPSSLLSVELGGSDAELLVQGTWQASLLGQAAVEASSSGLGLKSIQPLLFKQSPELFLSFLLFEKAFVEARVSDDIAQARYSFGYRGAEDESLESVKAGNDGISFPELPFLSLGEGSYRSFGLAAKLRGEGFSGTAMLRYDQATRASKRFSGGCELTDTVLAAQGFTRGRWLYIPGASASAPAGGLVLYVQSGSGTLPGGDGNSYRILGTGEYSFSSTTGFIALERAASTRVVARFDGYSSSGSGNVSIGGLDGLLLYDPEDYEHPYYQTLCRYPSSADPDSSEAFVRDATSGLKDGKYEVRIDPSGFAEVTRTDRPANPTDGSYARPFEYAADDEGLNWIYVTDLSEDGSLDYAPVSTRQIVLRSRSSVSSMAIDEDYIPGSVEVRRDGAPEYAFAIDEDLHVVELATPAGANEVIDINYLRQSSERKAGSLAAGLGGVWELGPGWSAWAALGLRWSVPGIGYGAADAGNPGSLVATAGEKDVEGSFRHRAALAASYSSAETSDRYRIEGMESSGSFATSFRPTSKYGPPADFSAIETSDSLLKKAFPKLVSTLHSDGATQQALLLTAVSTDPWSAELAKVVSTPAYSSFSTFSFFVMTSAASGSLVVALDEGGASTGAVEVTVPLDELATGAWHRILVRYGDLAVYRQDEEGGGEVAIGALAEAFDASSLASRLRIEVVGAAAGQEIRIDELCLEDSVGSGALLFQGDLSYENGDLRLGPGKLPLVAGLELKADASAGLHAASFASGGASLGTVLGPFGLKLKGRAGASADGDASLSGGHELKLPSFSFPLSASELFDFDPETGAFNKKDGISLSAGRVLGLQVSQGSSWSPGSASVEGIFAQEWKAKLEALGGRLALEAKAANRARPPDGPGLEDSGYGPAWIDTYSYVLPAFEADSDRRTASASLAASLGPGSEFLSASASQTSEPGSSDGGLRSYALAAKASIPLSLGGVKVAPYYRRSWTETIKGAGSGLLDDLKLALGDIAGFGPLYSWAPFVELADGSLASSFGDSTSGPDTGEAAYAPEAGLSLAREYGSYWYDLLAPASLAFAFRRELERSGDSLTDADAWELSSKTAAVNLFGDFGAYPSGLGFDSDEYLSTLKATLAFVEGEGSPRLGLRSQLLATFISGQYDRLDAENSLYASTSPSKAEWSEELGLSLSRRVARSWLLDLYRKALPAAAPGAKGGGEGKLVSGYLSDLASRETVARELLGLAVSVSGSRTDESSPDPSWSVEESYAAKLTVPERLTLQAKATLSQGRDGEEEKLSFGGSLELSLSLSF